ncbi:MAG: ATP-binding protein [Deltaproteobacteria bacterium]|nr:ATP-binding protein [Deltaproteobacteria bacterium]
MFKRPIHRVLMERMLEQRRFMQVLYGPRQTGKTTLAHQVMADLEIPSHYASADEPTLKDRIWIEQQWEIARLKVESEEKALFVLDEAQKIDGWSETVKMLWDEDTAKSLPLCVMLLGSSPLLVQRGLTESLAGRFEVIPVSHWSFTEMREAFDWGLDEYIFFGGYPGGADLINDPKRWSNYIKDALIETTISRDILLMTRVDKPALLRRLFYLGCSYSGQVLSYQKMLGQLQDVGNTTTLAHYLNLLEGAGLIAGLSKYAGQRVRQRASSPKLQVLNTALIAAQSQLTLEEAKQDTEYWGRLVESAIGATLMNGIRGENIEIFYWSSRNREVDFVLSRGNALVALEVKSGHRKVTLPGMETFSKEFPVTRKLLVGAQGIPVEDFLLTHPRKWISQ